MNRIKKGISGIRRKREEKREEKLHNK